MPLLKQIYISPGPMALGALRSLSVRSVTGTVKATFDGEEVELFAGMVVELPVGLEFSKVDVFAASGASAVLLYGSVSFRTIGLSEGGSSGGSMQIITDNFANPNGNATPADTDDAALYYQDTIAPNVWAWSVANQNWFQIIS
jgi:hypothetical protein